MPVNVCTQVCFAVRASARALRAARCFAAKKPQRALTQTNAPNKKRLGGINGNFFHRGWGDLGCVDLKADLEVISQWPPPSPLKVKGKRERARSRAKNFAAASNLIHCEQLSLWMIISRPPPPHTQKQNNLNKKGRVAPARARLVARRAVPPL
jgi:hypothetical protein